MNKYRKLYVDKTAQTFADELVMFGLIRLLWEVTGANVTVMDCGAYYELTSPLPLEQTALDQASGVFPIPFIQTGKNKENLPPEAVGVDYDAEREQRNLYFSAQDKSGVARPHPHWDIFRAINPVALPSYTALLENWWRLQSHLPEVLALLFDLYAAHPNDIEGAIEAWKQLDKLHGWGISAEATCQQLYNPDQGKGQNKTKADGLSIRNVKSFWLVEYLKAIGFYESAMTRLVRGAKDRKTFVVVPRIIDFFTLRQVKSQFGETMQFRETSTRFDILAAIRYTRTLIEYHLTSEDVDEPWLRESWMPRQEVAGFRTAFYKDLGNAVATMNLSFIALPGWIYINSAADARLYVELLNEIELVTRQFDENNSDAFRLLQHLRDFVSGDDLQAFFRFTSLFPSYYMGMKERNKYVRPFSTLFVERLMMSTDINLYEILMAEGFQNVAYAIRQSTITAQYRKKQGDRKYDVRYGLGQELVRKSRYPADFMVALSNFMHKFNAENAQIMETRGGPYRRSLKTSDIEEIAQLIDKYGSEVVGNMLVAYGYARLPREDDETAIAELEQEIEDNG